MSGRSTACPPAVFQYHLCLGDRFGSPRMGQTLETKLQDLCRRWTRIQQKLGDSFKVLTLYFNLNNHYYYRFYYTYICIQVVQYIHISMECVISVRTCEAFGRLTCVSLVGHYFRISTISFASIAAKAL